MVKIKLLINYYLLMISFTIFVDLIDIISFINYLVIQ